MADKSLGFNVTFDAQTKRAEQKIGAFARDLRQTITAAVRALPEIKLDATATKAEREIQKVRKELAYLSSKRIGIDIDEARAQARIDNLRAKLERLGAESTAVSVKANTAAAAAALDRIATKKVEPVVEPEVVVEKAERDVGAFAKRVRQDITRAIQALPEIDLGGDTTEAERALARIRAQLEFLRARDVGVHIDADEAQAELDHLRAQLVELSTGDGNVRVRADTAEAAAALGKLASTRVEPDVVPQVDVHEADRELGAFATRLQSRITAAVKALPDVELHADSTDVDRSVAAVRAELAALADKRVGVDISAADAEAEIRRLSTDLRRLGAGAADVQVRADVASALIALGAVERKARGLNGLDVRASVNVDASRALTMIAAVIGGLSTIGALSGPALAGAAAGGGLLGALGQGAAGIGIGISGIGDAVKDLDKVQSSTAGNAAKSDAGRLSRLDSIQSATRALDRAEQQRERARIQGEQQVADATLALDQARQDRRDSISEAVRQSTRDMVDATDALDAANKDLTRSTTELSQAMEAARKERRDDAFSYRDSALSQEEAAARLTAAKEKLQQATDEGLTDPADLKALDVAARRAQLSYDEATAKLSDATEVQQRWAQSGVRGSDTVRAAQDRVSSSADAVRQAQTNLERTTADSARRVAQARSQGDRQVQAASTALARAQQQAAWSNADAAAAVVDANTQMAQAMRSTATAGAGSAASLAKQTENFDKLGAAGKAYASFLHDDFYPAMRGIRDSAQATFLPKLQTSMTQVMDLAPLFSQKLADTGNVLGDLATKGSAMVTTGPWREDFGRILDSNNRQLASWGNAGLSAADATRNLWAASLPLSESFAKSAESSADMFATWIQGKRDSGELQAWMNRMGDELAALGSDVGDIVTAFVDWSQAMAPTGKVILDVIAALARGLSALAEANPVLLNLLGAGALVSSLLGKIGVGVYKLGATAGLARTGLSAFGGALSALSPTSLYSRLEGVRSRIDTVSTGAGLMAGQLRSSASAGEGVAKWGSRMGKVATGLVSGLPLVGVAFAGVTLLADLFGESQEVVAERAKQNSDSIRNLADALRESGGAITANVRAMKLKELQDKKFIDTGADVTDYFHRIGISARQLTTAILSSGADRNTVIDTLRTKSQETHRVVDKFSGAVQYKLTPQAQTAGDRLRWLNGQIANTGTAADQAKEALNDALAPQDATAVKTQKLAEAVQAFADAAGDASARGSAYKKVLDELSGKSQTVADAQADMYQSIDGLSQLQGNFSSAVDASTGKINAFSAQGSELQKAVGPLAEDFFSLADALTQSGMSSEEVANKLGPVRDSIVNKLANGLGIGTEKAKALATSLGIVPKDVSTGVHLNGVQAVVSGVKAINDSIDGVIYRDHTLTFSANDKDAVDKLKALGFKVERLPDGRFKVFANTKEGRDQIDQMVRYGNSKRIWIPTGAHTTWITPYLARVQQAFNKHPIALHLKPQGGFETSGGGVGGRGGTVGAFASGGPVIGPGSPTSDSILAFLSNGENVWPAATVAKLGGQDAVERLKRLIESGRLPRFAGGGPVTPAKRGRPAARAAPTAPAKAAAPALGAAVPLGSALADPVGALGGIAALSGQVQDLTKTGLAPMAAELIGKTVPALVSTQTQAGTGTANAVTRLRDTLPPLTTQSVIAGRTMRSEWAQNTVRVGTATAAMGGRMRSWQNTHNLSWRNMNAISRQNIQGITGAQFGSYRRGLGGLRSALSQTEGFTRTKYQQMYSHAAGPTRATLAGPFNRGIIRAWNTLDQQFALGKHVNPVPIKFATGGRVPGVGNRDTVPSLLTPGEYVIPKPVVHRWGLDNITRAHRRTLAGDGRGLEGMFSGDTGRLMRVQRFAKGGMVPARNDAIARASAFARRESGKPYIWGAVGPIGYDCSGFQSAITNTLRGENPHRRLGVARSQPWPGFQRGMKGAYSTGFSNVHTAGTLSGVNVEAGGSPSRVKYGAGAAGADSSQFPGHAWLPMVGGRFVSGGAGGGSIDPAAFVGPAFDPVTGMIRSVSRRYPGNRMGMIDTGVASRGQRMVRSVAEKKLAAALAASGGGGGGSQRWSQLVLRALAMTNQPASLLSTVLRRMDQESGGDPRAINNWDSNAAKGTPSKGLMQLIDGTFAANRDPRLPNNIWEPLSNIVASLRYAMRRYGSVSAAFDRAGGYRRGGKVRGSGFGDTVPLWAAPGEGLLTRSETAHVEDLARALHTRRGVAVVRAAGLVASGQAQGASGPIISVGTIMQPPTATATQVVGALRTLAREAKQVSQ